MRYLILLIAILAVMSGCASSGGYIPVTGTMVNEAGQTVQVTSAYVKDASILKEQAIANTLRNRDNNYRMAHENSGFKLKFAMVEINGTMAYLPEEISFRETPHFDQPLPTEPSEHPVWKTVNSSVAAIAKYGMIGFGISELSGIVKSGYDAAGNHFNGDANISNGFNSVGNDFNSGGYQYNGPYNPALQDGGEELGELVTLPDGSQVQLPASCSSLESYLAGAPGCEV